MAHWNPSVRRVAALALAPAAAQTFLGTLNKNSKTATGNGKKPRK